MAKVSFKRIESSNNIDNIDIVDGNFIVTGDGKSYIDYGINRTPIGGTPDSEMSDTSRNTVENKVVKEYVDNSIDNAKSEVNGQILWENPNKSSTFVSQTITLSSGDYDVYEIFYYNWVNQKLYSSVKTKKGNNVILQTMILSSNMGYVGARNVYYSSPTSLSFGDNYSIIDNNTIVVGARNEWNVPIYVIGYKTGLFE